jgi:acetolactate synthase I/II/III large subunit
MSQVSRLRPGSRVKSVAQQIVTWLESQNSGPVFGIPGVHTIELYRALARSELRHVTARSEAGAGFMADGYARVSGRFATALVITGPGMTNILTAMAQARADSVPMLVISGVNARDTLGKGLGYLHELPDQQALVRALCPAFSLRKAEELPEILAQVGEALLQGRPGPVHLEVPLDLMAASAPDWATSNGRRVRLPDTEAARAHLDAAGAPVIIAGGGAKRECARLQALAEALDAPVVLTTNARGLMHGHRLTVPASPSLAPVRTLIAGADAVLVVGSELGPTDYDMYGVGGLPDMSAIVRVDICPTQLARHPARFALAGDTGALLPRLMPAPRQGNGVQRARDIRAASTAALPPDYSGQVALLGELRAARPGAIMVGDSTQIVYAGNLYYDHDRPGGWFNAATGYGALGYAPGAAVGAALAAPGVPVLCLIGDGGLMFAPGEMVTAAELGLNITFLVFNNHGFGEIASAMRLAGSAVIGCHPRPVEMEAFARACGLAFARCQPDNVVAALDRGPRLIEVTLERC